MLIMIAGPYTANAETGKEKQRNLDILNDAAYEVYKKGHIPLIGVNNGLPVIERANVKSKEEFGKVMMDICLELAERCDAILLLKESPGANMERDVFIKNGKKVYTALEEIPKI
jgi:hypothetical protein